MNFFQKAPEIGEVVVVPLVHPNGAYIRLDNGAKVPVLAKVRAKFGESVNVINFFGYVYNVPISHTEKINSALNTQFYVEMIQNCQNVMHSLGYSAKDNTEFYATIPGANTYSFFSYLPGYQNQYVVSPSLFNDSPPRQSKSYSHPKPNKPNVLDDEDLGSITVMKIDDGSILHYINKTNNSVLFNSSSGALDIQGYGRFLVDTSYTYSRTGDPTEYIAFRSNKNFIHVKKTRVVYVNKVPEPRVTKGSYNVKMIRLRKTEPKHQKYYDVVKIIYDELWD
ncbi:hypothetical protein YASMINEVIRUS_1146 [Yasminevirus sp. GU-2018]|uniref:Uncharacterized protein n=1 Tax=Yasminevirus sp. GU-2018 TaxID=2420051 RepID=A0A5K0UAX4_9VIRU|nr:hypothetical protein YASMINEVIRUS_1146 [Yasminevirus sp. GU-2018]